MLINFAIKNFTYNFFLTLSQMSVNPYYQLKCYICNNKMKLFCLAFFFWRYISYNFKRYIIIKHSLSFAWLFFVLSNIINVNNQVNTNNNFNLSRSIWKLFAEDMWWQWNLWKDKTLLKVSIHISLITSKNTEILWTA